MSWIACCTERTKEIGVIKVLGCDMRNIRSMFLLEAGFIDSFRDRIKSLEIKSLPPLYDDKFLYSSERVELRDDYRGIPETNYYMSSANE